MSTSTPPRGGTADPRRRCTHAGGTTPEQPRPAGVPGAAAHAAALRLPRHGRLPRLVPALRPAGRLRPRLHGHQAARQHQRRLRAGAAAVRLDLRHRVRLLALRGRSTSTRPPTDPGPARGDPQDGVPMSVLAAGDSAGGAARPDDRPVPRLRRPDPGDHAPGEPQQRHRRGLLLGRPLAHRAPERGRHRRRLHVGRELPRHRRDHRAVGLRRLPVLDRLPRRLAGRAAARGRAAAQQRQVHDGRRPRVPDAPAAGPGRRRHLDDHRVDLLPARADGRRRRARHPAARRHQPGREEHHHRRRRRPDDLLRHGRRHEGHHLGADHQGRHAHDRRHARDDPGDGEVRRQRQRAARRRRRQERQGRGVPQTRASVRHGRQGSPASSTCSASASRSCSARPACRTS